MHFTYRLSNQYSEQVTGFALWLVADTADSRATLDYTSLAQ